MTVQPIRLATVAFACLLVLNPAQADSAASSTSSASSASVASLSDSVSDSSERSSADRKVAQGEYRVVRMAELVERPDHLRLTLQALAPNAGGAQIDVTLPRQALAQRALAIDDRVRISERPYGLEFAYAGDRQAFFLALTDDWLRELEPRVVTF